VLDGVARGARILAIQVYYRSAADTPLSDPVDQMRALQYIYLTLRNRYPIAAINLSLGGGSYPAACDAANQAYKLLIDNLNAVNIPTIIASGNQGYPAAVNFPACISSAVQVGNTTKADLLWRSSNHSPLVKLLAPGTNIKAAITGNKYGIKTGTSMAAPHVAGAFALLKRGVPGATLPNILQALTCTGKPIYKQVPKPPAVVQANVDPVRSRIDLLGAYNYLKRPPNVLRVWRFDTAADAKDWAPFNGIWNTVGGMYQPTSKSLWVESSVANCDSRLEVTAKLRRVDPTPKDASNPLKTFVWNSGVWLKTYLDASSHTVSGYFFAFSKAYYCTVPPKPIGDPNTKCLPPGQLKQGQGAVFRLTRSNYDTGNVDFGVSLCFKSIPITVSGLNTLRIVADGSNYSFYLNNQLVCSFVDLTFVSGPVVLAAAIPCAPAPAACPTPTSGHLFQADSVSIKSLETAPTLSPEATTMDTTRVVPQDVAGIRPEFGHRQLGGPELVAESGP